MARLVSYKPRDDRYSTFDGERSYNSSENLTERNRIKILLKSKSKSSGKKKKEKTKKKNAATTGDTMPTISASVEMHGNKIAQSTSRINCLSDNITRGRRRQSSHRTSSSKSKFNCCLNGWLCCCRGPKYNRSSSCSCREWCTNRCGINCWRKWCCCLSPRKCCCGGSNFDDDEDDDDDIDAKFERYKYELRLKELNSNCVPTDAAIIDTSDAGESTVQFNFHRNEASVAIDTNQAHHCPSTPNATANGKNQKTKKFSYRKYWNWNDSLRSNSDKFLETLEYDMDGEQSLKRSNDKDKRNGFNSAKGY